MTRYFNSSLLTMIEIIYEYLMRKKSTTELVALIIYSMPTKIMQLSFFYYNLDNFGLFFLYHSATWEKLS